MPYFIYRLRDAMLADPTGRRILRDRPRITSATLSLPALRALPEHTVGREYVTWLDREGVSPDTRANVSLLGNGRVGRLTMCRCGILTTPSAHM